MSLMKTERPLIPDNAIFPPPPLQIRSTGCTERLSQREESLQGPANLNKERVSLDLWIVYLLPRAVSGRRKNKRRRLPLSLRLMGWWGRRKGLVFESTTNGGPAPEREDGGAHCWNGSGTAQLNCHPLNTKHGENFPLSSNRRRGFYPSGWYFYFSHERAFIFLKKKRIEGHVFSYTRHATGWWA